MLNTGSLAHSPWRNQCCFRDQTLLASVRNVVVPGTVLIGWMNLVGPFSGGTSRPLTEIGCCSALGRQFFPPCWKHELYVASHVKNVWHSSLYSYWGP
jgi:hypothetical protein